MTFEIKIEPEAHIDIQEAIDWYNHQQQGLGRKFYFAVLNRIDSLAKNPYFEIRYGQVRCLPVEKFPYTVHFTVNDIDMLVVVRAVSHTSLNPDNWSKR